MQRKTQLFVCLTYTVVFITGCGEAPVPKTQTDAKPPADHAGHKDGDEHETATTANVKGGHEHSDWWCNEHGVPEEECAQCNSKIAAEFQKKGDWCKKHKRPDSQCFKCHPELQAKFAAKYEAKYGKQPPEPEVD